MHAEVPPRCVATELNASHDPETGGFVSYFIIRHTHDPTVVKLIAQDTPRIFMPRHCAVVHLGGGIIGEPLPYRGKRQVYDSPAMKTSSLARIAMVV